jgi:long-chain acyl-CoA synthetase
VDVSVTSILGCGSLPELFCARSAVTPWREAYRQFDPVTAKWVSYTWADVEARVTRWSAALQGEGLIGGARVGLLVANSVEHVCMDQAALGLGCVTVPMHVVDNPESLAYVIADSGMELLFVDSAARWEALVALRERFPALRRVIYLTGSPPAQAEPIAMSLEEWLAAHHAAPAVPDPLALAESLSPESLAAIVYTSGTTGRPKGVMLSHRNIMANVNAILNVMPITQDDVFLSFLPLSHTLERTVGYYLPIAAGAVVVFSRSIPLLMSDLASVRPTVLVSVPRIYERAYAAIQESVAKSPLKRWLLESATALGWRQFEFRQKRAPRPPFLARCALAILDEAVGVSLRRQFGGRLRCAVTGGAPILPSVARPFLALGIPLLQGYGMTESAPVISCNIPQDNDPASVGRPLQGVEVRIGDNDELLARGLNVMQGYWHRPEETRRVLEPDGWLHTGDQARLENGRVYIKGRLKDIIVTSTGEKIAPGDLEAAIATDPLFEQVMVVGEQRPYLAALIVLNAPRWATESQRLGLAADRDTSLKSPAVIESMLLRIKRLVRGFPSYATPRAVFLTGQPWTIGAGLITPTLKPKRAAIESRFAAEIAALYRGH